MNRFLRPCLLLLSCSLLLAPTARAAEPKKLLVVSASVGARHASIPNGEKMLRELAAKSNGQFAFTFMSDATDYPFSRLPGGGRAGGPIPGFPAPVATLNATQQDALTLAGQSIAPLVTAATAARTALTAASLSQPTETTDRAETLAAAELSLALARANALATVQSSANRLTPEQRQSLSGTAPAAGRGGVPAPDNNPVLARLFQQHLSPAALAGYDGIIFLSSTGLLPFPDRDAFLKWVSDGKAVIALHAAMDTGYHTPDAHMEMLSGGARYATSVGGNTTARTVHRVDANHPATRDWPEGLAVVDEFFQFTRKNPADKNTNLPGLDRSKVHSLLDADIDGQRQPVAWTRLHGRGRVFYSGLGHRDDVMLPATPAMDGNAKLNPDPVAAAYQAHLLGGIRWALGLAEGNNTPGNAR